MNKKQHIKNVLVLIPTYNSEANIFNLIKSLIRQKRLFFSMKVLVYSDCSSDNSYKEAKKIKSRLLIVKEGKKRLGFGGVVKKFLLKNRYDAVVILNDDIKIENNNIIVKLLKPMIKTGNVGMVSGNPLPIHDESFVSRAIESSYKAYEKMRYSFKKGNSVFTCDGKILALSKKFIKSIDFPSDIKMMGNVDSFLYMCCINNGFIYKHVRSAKVYYKNPDNTREYVSWTLRNNANELLLKKQFGALVNKEYKQPNNLWLFEFIEALKNPPGSIYLLIVKFYVKLKIRDAGKWFTPTWDVVSSTKKNLN